MRLYDGDSLQSVGYEAISLQALRNRVYAYINRTQSEEMKNSLENIIGILNEYGNRVSGRCAYYSVKNRACICYFPVIRSFETYDVEVDGGVARVYKVNCYTDNETYWAPFTDVLDYGIKSHCTNLEEIYDEYANYDIEEEF